MQPVNRFPGIRGAALAAALVFCLPGATGAQVTATGRITGRVINDASGRPIELARVAVVGTSIEARTDLDGRYFLANVPVGAQAIEVRVIGYTAKTVSQVSVRPGETTVLDVTMVSAVFALEEITVTAEVERGSAAAVLDSRRSANMVVDAVGSGEISRLPASDAADVAGRMTGMTVTEGRYVYVRGLGDRYSQTTLNGSPLPSPEPERAVVPLDLFPSGFLETVTAQKTYTPDQAAEFSGGAVQIDLKDFPDRFRASLGIGTKFNSMSAFRNDFFTYPGGGRDFLGIDDGTRALPPVADSLLGGLRGNRLPADPAVVETIGEALQRRFTPGLSGTPANRSLDVTLGVPFRIGRRELGFFAGLTYSDEYQIVEDEQERKFRNTAFDPSVPADRRIPNIDYVFDRSTRQVSLGTVANLSVLLSPIHKVSIRTTFSRNAEDEARTFEGLNNEDLGGFVHADRLRFVSRELYWGQLAGEHRFLFGSQVEWRATLAEAHRAEPGLREAIYLSDGDTTGTFLLENVGESSRYLFSELDDVDRTVEMDWRIPFAVWSHFPAALKVGAAYRDRERDFAARRFVWSFQPGLVTNIDSALTDEAIVGAGPVGPGQFLLRDIVEPGDLYGALDERQAGYAMMELPLTRSLRLVGGARVESYALEVISRGDTLSRLEQTDVLPAVNVIYDLGANMNLRAAASQTVDRPEFRELAPFQFTEAASLRQVYGNPDLTVATIKSLDLRWDWFPRPGELISISGFYKALDEPIEQVFIAAASTAFSYQNADRGRLFGVEFDIRQRLDRLAPALAPLAVQGNLSLIDSEVEVRQTGTFQPTNMRRPLEGQSTYAVNAGLLYLSFTGATEAAVFVNRFGERLTAAGGSGVPDIIEQPRTQVDVTFKQQLLPALQLKLKGTNLLNQPYRFAQSANGITHVQREYRTGVGVSMGLTYGFGG